MKLVRHQLDVGLLYEIITRAERDPEVDRLPFRALFAAYDAVLADHGSDADPEQICMRFLFKMGNNTKGGAIRGRSIFERFEELLQQMGIVLDLDDLGETGEITPDHMHAELTEELERNNLTNCTEPRDRISPGGSATNTHRSLSRRRASFNSMYDVGEDATQRSRANRPSSRSSMSRLQVGKTGFDMEQVPPSKLDEITGYDDSRPSNRSELLAQFLDIGRKLMGGLDPAAGPMNTLVGQNRLIDEKVPSARLGSDVLNEYSDILPPTDSLVSTPRGFPRNAHQSLQNHMDDDVPLNGSQLHKVEISSRPKLSDLLREASTFSMYRRRETARRLLDQWIAKTYRIQQYQHDMNAVATSRDRITLLRQAFELWRSNLHRRKQATRTERFFKHLERRAEKARDLYLTTRAFTHWAQLTTEQQAKVSEAREHVLRVKYFNAWKKITAVNELKAERFAITRPFKVWRARTGRIEHQEAMADAFYVANLKKRSYWKWFWSFCDCRAPQWYDWCLKRRSLIYWLRKIRTQKEREQEVDQQSRHMTIERNFHLWLRKFRAVTSSKKDADLMYSTKILRMELDEWRIMQKLSSTVELVTYKVEKRISQKALWQWVSRTRAALRAVDVDRLRLMRDAWIAWSDCLRCQALQTRIHERLKKEALYKWVINERYHLMTRVREQHALQNIFSTVKHNTVEKSRILAQQEKSFIEFKEQKSLRSKLSHWHDQLSIQLRQDFIALEFYAPRVTQEALEAWNSRHQHVKRWKKRAEDARFYFLMMRTIKTWRAATVEAAKRRRKTAYVTVRVSIKTRLARNILDCWTKKTQDLRLQEEQAAEFFSRKSNRLVRDTLHRWLTKNRVVRQTWLDSEIYYDRQLAYQQLARWNEVSKNYSNIEQQAMAVDLVRVSGVGAAQLRKFSLRIFQIRSSSETADAMNERLLKKHFRSMFYYWLQRVRRQRENQTISWPEVQPEADRFPQTPASAIFAHPESLFDLSQVVPSTNLQSTTPAVTPSYLSSPSKRAARARMLAQMTTTPATPLSTPFAVRLRAARTPERSSVILNGSAHRRSIGTTVRFADDYGDGDDEERSPSRR